MKKKIGFSICLTVLICLNALLLTACSFLSGGGGGGGNLPPDPNAVIHPDYEYEGAGTESSPYEIYTREDLEAIGEGQNVYYKLMNDLDLSGDDWTPVTSKCDFDGGGFTISGASYYASETHAIFGAVTGSLKNLNVIVDHEYSASIRFAGGIAGTNSGTITHCTVTGKLYAGNSSSIALVGGIVGRNTGAISFCATDVEIEARTARCGVGGIAGGISREDSSDLYAGNGSIKNCSSKGTITVLGSFSRAGGIAGEGVFTIESCFSEMQINVDSSTASNVEASIIGGIAAGYIGSYHYSGGTQLTVSNCYFVGSISAVGNKLYVGGLVGRVYSVNSAGAQVANKSYRGIVLRSSYIDADLSVNKGGLLSNISNTLNDFHSSSTSTPKLVEYCYDARETDIRVAALTEGLSTNYWVFDNEHNPTLKNVKVITIEEE